MTDENVNDVAESDRELEQELVDICHDVMVMWGKVPPLKRTEPDGKEALARVKEYVEGELEKVRRRVTAHDVGIALKPRAAPDAPTVVHSALRLVRRLDHREWAMVRTLRDFHRFSTPDVREMLGELHESHCVRCSAWLDDDDEHTDCPAREDEEAAQEAAPRAQSTGADGEDDDGGDEDEDGGDEDEDDDDEGVASDDDGGSHNTPENPV